MRGACATGARAIGARLRGLAARGTEGPGAVVVRRGEEGTGRVRGASRRGGELVHRWDAHREPHGKHVMDLPRDGPRSPRACVCSRRGVSAAQVRPSAWGWRR